MKPWSSPALFAVGWYLLMPPFVGGKPDIEAPLSRWDQSAKFTSLSDCSDERDRQLKNVAQEAQQIGTEHEQSSDLTTVNNFQLQSKQSAHRNAYRARSRGCKQQSYVKLRRIILGYRVGMAKSQ